MPLTLTLPDAAGTLVPYTLQGSAPVRPANGVPFNRIAYPAAHVVADPLAPVDPWLDCAIDWDAAIAYRRHLWSLGLGVAEAMGTAQRGMGLDWPTSLELIGRSLDAARDVPGALLASGCGTDQLILDSVKTIDEVIAGYEEQMEAIEKLGGKLIVMASRALARVATSPADYERVYDRILTQARQPVVLHWLGEMFDPALAGYWGSGHVDQAMETALGVIAANPGKVDGIKISLLDKDKEIDMRRRLPLRADVDRRRFQLCRADRRRRPWTGTDAWQERRAARDFRRDRAGGERRAGGTGAGKCRTISCHPRPHGAPVAPYIRRANALLQDRRRLHGLVQRTPKPLHDGRRPAEHALAGAFVRAVPLG